jgi:hypothetical protein
MAEVSQNGRVTGDNPFSLLTIIRF